MKKTINSEALPADDLVDHLIQLSEEIESVKKSITLSPEGKMTKSTEKKTNE